MLFQDGIKKLVEKNKNEDKSLTYLYLYKNYLFFLFIINIYIYYKFLLIINSGDNRYYEEQLNKRKNSIFCKNNF